MINIPNSDNDLWEEIGQSNQRLIHRDDMKTIYDKCKSITSEEKKDKQRRGYVFQNLIYSALYHEGLNPRTSYRPKGEEIDGAFFLNHRTFLLEAKWVADPIPASDVYQFKCKVDGKLIGTLGIVISMSGYSEDAPEALEKGKIPNVILFDKTDMDAIFIHDHKFIEVLDFKLRQAGEVGKTFVPFELPKVIAEAESVEVVVDAAEISHIEYNKQLVLILCEGHTDALVLKCILRRLIDRRFYAQIAIEVKSLGGRMGLLRKLPEIVSVVQYSSERHLLGVVVVLDTDTVDFELAFKLGEEVEDHIKKMAILTPVHLTFAMPSIEAWVGLNKEKMPSGSERLELLQNAVDRISMDELLAIDEIKDMITFIEELGEPDELLWESDAREAVEHALESAEWDLQKGIVIIKPTYEHQPTIECNSIESLRTELIELATIGANNSMPYEGGIPVFDIDYWGLVDEILIDNYEQQIKEMGWEL